MSYLKEVKEYCNIPSDDDIYNNDIVSTLNSALGTLEDIGVEVIQLITLDNNLSDSISNEYSDTTVSMIDEYLKLETKETIDPSANSIVSKAYSQKKDKLIWYIKKRCDL